jgi:hypothetical protein
MKKLLFVVALIAICATSAFAAVPYTGAWTQTWDFNDGTQGWTLNGSAAWYATGANGSGTIYAPDTSFASLATLVTAAGGKGFVFQADVYVGATNYLQGSGISVGRTGDFKGPWATGTAAGSQGVAGNDKSWFNTTKNKSWGLAVGQWTTMQIDYNVSYAGKFTVGYTACVGNGAGWTPGSWAWCIDENTASNAVHPSQIFERLALGGGVNGAATGWSQAQFDNVKLAIVPEPGSFVALGSGLVGLVGFAIRRRK